MLTFLASSLLINGVNTYICVYFRGVENEDPFWISSIIGTR
jgi:hypothetical protein